MKKRFITLLGILLIFSVYAQKPNINLSDIWQRYSFYARTIQGIRSMKDGELYNAFANSDVTTSGNNKGGRVLGYVNEKAKYVNVYYNENQEVTNELYEAQGIPISGEMAHSSSWQKNKLNLDDDKCSMSDNRMPLLKKDVSNELPNQNQITLRLIPLPTRLQQGLPLHLRLLSRTLLLLLQISQAER